ncbi:MAG: 30S ribosome-binding factor RbfA [Endomicrobia bacterium]|nr:30S ribosome-binding factor RbfA [Endomicrobiia bacterium]
MPLSYKRSTRVGALIKETVSDIIRDIRELNVGLVTIMGVKLTDDLLTCRIFYSVFGSDEDKKNVANVLKDKTKDVRHALAVKLNLRRTPTIEFVYDDSNENASKVFDILDKIKSEE